MALEPLAADITCSATVGPDLTVTQARVTKQIAEILAKSSAPTRSTKQVAEVLSKTASNARVTKQIIEILSPTLVLEPLEAAITTSVLLSGNLSGIVRQFAAGITTNALLVANVETPQDLVVGISVTALVNAILDKNVEHASDTITFTQNAAAFNISAGNTLTLTQSVSVEQVLNKTISDTLTLTDVAEVEGIFNKSRVSEITFAQTATTLRSLPTEAASSTLTLTDSGDYARATLDALNLNQLAVGSIGGLFEGTDSPITLTQTVSLNTVTFLSSSNNFLFSQVIDSDQVTTKTADSTLLFNQLALPLTLKDKTYVILQAPFEFLQTSIVLPAPLFGDTENITGEVTLNRSMNGRTTTTVKTNSMRRLNYTFRIHDELKANELLEFLRYYNSDLIKLTNWKGEIWKVNVLTNPIDFIQTGRHNFDIALEFVGDRIF